LAERDETHPAALGTNFFSGGAALVTQIMPRQPAISYHTGRELTLAA
jgi:hypothetical protein